MMNSQITPSPCIKACALLNQICTGCGRTIEEIQSWRLASDEQKRAILIACAKRKQHLAAISVV